MSEPENFLSRWTRLKHEAATPDAPDEAAPTVQSGDDTAASPAPPEVDLSALPSIESITAATDLRGFLAPGVPAELTRAALRRAWVADPAIRDFIGIAENQWDFTAADSIPGFGPLGPLDDVAKLVRRILGEIDPEPQSTQSESQKEQQIQRESPQLAGSATELAPVPEDVVHNVPIAGCELDVATQYQELNTASQDENAKQKSTNTFIPRRGGGALPQ